MKESFEKLYQLCGHLGKECAWDREETIHSFYKNLIDEAKEVEEAVKDNDAEQLKEELGDVLWNVLFLTKKAEAQGLFVMKEVIDMIHEKMVRRHPHVFKEKTDDVKRIKELWEEIKVEEKKMKVGREKKPIVETSKHVGDEK